MRLIILIFLVTVCGSQILSQPVYTKDMVFVGYRDDLMQLCIEEQPGKYLNVNNHIIETYYYCYCVLENLIPRLKSSVISENSDFQSLFLKKKYFNMLEPCIKHYAIVKDAYEWKPDPNSDIEHEILKQMCLDNFRNDSLVDMRFADEMVSDYCDCFVSAILEKKYSFDKVFEMGDENSEIFNEIAMPCFDAFLMERSVFMEGTSYQPEDILGDGAFSKVPLLDYAGTGFKLSISIDGITNYFLFDTGASTFIISSELEKNLRLNGSITSDDYLGKELYILADGKTVSADIIRLSNIKIGEYTVNNVKAAIIEEGTLLCGISLMNKFKKWELDAENMLLILYK